MNSGDEKLSVLFFDLPGRVWPTPETTAFSQADLMQFAGKYRGFYNDTAAEEVAVAGGSFIPVLRRRRR